MRAPVFTVLTLGVLALLPAMAGAQPADGIYKNPKGTVMQVKSASDAGFDFSLTAGAPNSATSCPEGATDCLHIEGHADAAGKGFTFIDATDDRSRVFFAQDGDGVKVLSTTGDFGTGSANRAQMLALAGSYAAQTPASPAKPAQTPVAPAQPEAKPAQPQIAQAEPAKPDTTPAPSDNTAPSDNSTDTSSDDLHFFQSPTGNIACLFSVGKRTEVRCDLAKLNATFTNRPADCDLDWGDSFSIAEREKHGQLVCHGDTVINPDAPPLAYGSSLTYGRISCISAKDGMTCQNGAGHGFTISRKLQQVF